MHGGVSGTQTTFVQQYLSMGDFQKFRAASGKYGLVVLLERLLESDEYHLVHAVELYTWHPNSATFSLPSFILSVHQSSGVGK